MPLVTIDLHEGTTTPERRDAISGAIHAAMIEVLDIPTDDRFHVFHELPAGSMFHEDEAFGRPRDQRLMFVTLSFNHRSPEQKAQLFEALVRHLSAVDVGPDDLLLRILETASENWWGSGRVVDPATGYDARMHVAADGSVVPST